MNHQELESELYNSDRNTVKILIDYLNELRRKSAEMMAERHKRIANIPKYESGCYIVNEQEKEAIILKSKKKVSINSLN